METPPHSKPLKAKTFSLVTLLLCLPLVEGNASPHQVHRITWRVSNTETGNTVTETTGLGPIATYFPTLTVDLCDTVGKSWDPSPQEPFPGYGCQHPGWQVKPEGMTFMYVLAIREVVPRFGSVEGPQKDTVRPRVAKQQEMSTGTPLRPGI